MNIKQVAHQIGVSVATVSRAFNAPEQVNPVTRERVCRMARDMGYVPNASARTLRTRRSRVLGVVLPTLSNPVFAECLEGVAAAAHEAGYAIMPMTTGYDAAQEARCVELLQAENVDGLLLVVARPGTSKALRQLKQASVPYVLLYNRHRQHPCVTVDSASAVAELVRRLIALGHRRLTMVSGPLGASDRAAQRHEGFLKAVRDTPVRHSALLEVPFLTASPELIIGHLASRQRPTALVCSNDLLALRCLRAAQLAGLQVPQDISIVGFDGIALGLDTMPMLSTIVQPHHETGCTGVRLLVRAVAHRRRPDPSESVLLTHHFRAGESCAAAPGAIRPGSLRVKGSRRPPNRPLEN